MVFAFAGDSTITSDVEPGSDGWSPSRSSTAVFRALVARVTLLAVLVARFAVVLLLAVLAFAIISAPLCCRRRRKNPRDPSPPAIHADRRALSALRTAALPAR